VTTDVSPVPNTRFFGRRISIVRAAAIAPEARCCRAMPDLRRGSPGRGRHSAAAPGVRRRAVLGSNPAPMTSRPSALDNFPPAHAHRQKQFRGCERARCHAWATTSLAAHLVPIPQAQRIASLVCAPKILVMDLHIISVGQMIILGPGVTHVLP
jgi:hypothetical protein